MTTEATEAHNGPADPRTANGTPDTPEALLATNASAGNGHPAALPIPGRNGIPAQAIVHGACRKWWTGNERSHASCCHETFSSLTAFDRHRKGGQCNDPASVGLVARAKPYGTLWGFPAPEGGYAFHTVPAAATP